jgi:phenylalanyl-tRNA synthetase alpha chain
MYKKQTRYLRYMEELLKQVENYKREIDAYEASTAEGAEAFRIKYLGSKGLVKTLMSEMKNVPNEQKKNFG